jgi:hypothetical protein
MDPFVLKQSNDMVHGQHANTTAEKYTLFTNIHSQRNIGSKFMWN